VDSPVRPSTIHVSSGFGVTTREPYVQIVWKGEVAQLTPAEARQHALSILEVAEAAEQDAFLFTYAHESVAAHLETSEQRDRVAGQLLMEFREWRKKHGT
jgi:hypothetical protein